MKVVLFLDFDGVLVPVPNYAKRPFAQPWAPADPECVARLNRLLDEAEFQIIVCSTWRHYWDMHLVFKDFGIHGTPAGITRELSRSRGEEILLYLAEHDIEQFVILDDDHDGMSDLAQWHVKPDQYKGLQDEHIEQARAILARGRYGRNGSP